MFFISVETPFLRVLGVCPHHVAVAMPHAIFEFTRLFSAILVEKLSIPILKTIEPFPSVGVPALVLKHSVTMLLPVPDFSLLFTHVFVNNFALTRRLVPRDLVIFKRLNTGSGGLLRNGRFVHSLAKMVVFLHNVKVFMDGLAHFFNFWTQIESVVISFELLE